jgi:hypothetical protein
MTDPRTSITDAIDEAIARRKGILTPEDYRAVYAEVADALGVPLDDVRDAERARLTMQGAG